MTVETKRRLWVERVLGVDLAPFLGAVTPYQRAAVSPDNDDLVQAVGADDLPRLLQAADLPSGAGSASLRLRRALAVPGVGGPPDFAGLAEAVAAQAAIDEKILRGRTGPPLPRGVPQGAHRTLIGGHSGAILTEPATDLLMPDNPLGLPTAEGGAVTVNANGTRGVKFRKLLRPDGGGFVAAAAAGGATSIAARLLAVADAALVTIAAAATLPAYPATIVLGAKTFQPGQKPYDVLKAKHDTRRDAAMAKQPIFIAKRSDLDEAARRLAAAARTVTDPDNARQVGAFDAEVQELLSITTSIAQFADSVDGAGGTVAASQQQAIGLDYKTDGPVLSVAKISTLAPAAMSEDDILITGDQVSTQPATLLRQRPGNDPADGSAVETKHHQLVPVAGQDVLWVAMKSGVTFHKPPSRVDLGGTLISSYPTSLIAIPPDPTDRGTDADGFCTIANIPP